MRSLAIIVMASTAQADEPAERPPEMKIALDDDAITRAMQKQRSMLARCVTEQKHRQPDRSGTLVMKFTILPNGRTTKISVMTPELRDSSFAVCVSRLISILSFPPHTEQGDPIEAPFKF